MNYVHLVPLAQGIFNLKVCQMEAMSLSFNAEPQGKSDPTEH